MGGIIDFYKENGMLPKVKYVPSKLPKLATLMTLKLIIEGDIAYFRSRGLKEITVHLLHLRHKVIKMIRIKSEEPDIDELVS